MKMLKKVNLYCWATPEEAMLDSWSADFVEAKFFQETGGDFGRLGSVFDTRLRRIGGAKATRSMLSPSTNHELKDDSRRLSRWRT